MPSEPKNFLPGWCEPFRQCGSCRCIKENHHFQNRDKYFKSCDSCRTYQRNRHFLIKHPTPVLIDTSFPPALAPPSF